jgi:hypothetical protein
MSLFMEEIWDLECDKCGTILSDHSGVYMTLGSRSRESMLIFADENWWLAADKIPADDTKWLCEACRDDLCKAKIGLGDEVCHLEKGHSLVYARHR